MKKILSLTLAVLMVVSMIPTAFAADTQDYSLGTAVEYTANADANRSYTITVPAELQPGQSGTVTLKGKWASNETVKVTADANVVLTNSINSADQKTLAITFAGIEKAGDNTVEKTYTETVAVAAMPTDALFGTWSGKFNYNVELVEDSTGDSGSTDSGTTVEPGEGQISFTIDGVSYLAEEGMKWGEWAVSEYNTTGYKYTPNGTGESAIVYFTTQDGEKFGITGNYMGGSVIKNDFAYTLSPA